MLKSIADRAGRAISVVDYAGSVKLLKLLNTAYLGIRKLHTDQQAVATLDSGIVAGDALNFQDGSWYIVSMLTTDFYKSQPIRLWLDLVECNNKVTVKRPTAIDNGQGGIIGKSDVVVWENVPVKIGTIVQSIDKQNDTTYSQFGMLLPVKFPVKQGDILIFESFYDMAKVEGIKLNYEGIFEIAFDKDPRWRIDATIGEAIIGSTFIIG